MLVDNSESMLSKLGILKLVQVSMDRLNVNWLFYDKLSVMWKDEQLITGNCSLPSGSWCSIDRCASC